MRYLVTGGRGFIGRHLIRRLLAVSADVHATTRAGRSLEPGPRWWMCDLADLDATQQVVSEVRPDVVVHLASRAAGTRALDAVVPMLADNLLSAVHVMTASAAVPSCRAVLAGSIEEIATAAGDDGVQSPYAASKVAATAYAELFRDLWDLPVTVLRLAMVYGPDEPNRKRLVPYVIDSLLRGVTPELSSGRRRVDWVYMQGGSGHRDRPHRRLAPRTDEQAGSARGRATTDGLGSRARDRRRRQMPTPVTKPTAAHAKPSSALTPSTRSTDQRAANTSTAATAVITSGTGRSVVGSGRWRASGPVDVRAKRVLTAK